MRFGGAEEKSAPTGVAGVESMVVRRSLEMSTVTRFRLDRVLPIFHSSPQTQHPPPQRHSESNEINR